jgi:hypothetical protein
MTCRKDEKSEHFGDFFSRQEKSKVFVKCLVKIVKIVNIDNKDIANTRKATTGTIVVLNSQKTSIHDLVFTIIKYTIVTSTIFGVLF